MVTQMPNPATDPIRRFVVVAFKGSDYGPVLGYRVIDRTDFLPAELFRAAVPGRFAEGRPTDEALAEAKTQAEQRRRDLNWCEAFGHHFDVLAERCVTCGVQP